MELLKGSKLQKFTSIENDLIYREDLSVYEKMIYITLASYSDDNSCCFPSCKTISKKVGCSERQVSRALNNLESKNLIQRKKYRSECKNNMYFVFKSNSLSNKTGSPMEMDSQSYDIQTQSPINNIKKNNIKYNSYLDLTFLDMDIEKVKITEKSYKLLINKFGKEIVHNKIGSLENYIVNGDGEKYKNHEKVLTAWCSKEYKDKESKDPLRDFKKL
ncbi:helix-turn-helix domain-containing protein [Clostridioides difficile]